jgi:hypothetical protein
MKAIPTVAAALIVTLAGATSIAPDHEYIAVGPLMPLGLLMADP